MTFACQPSTGNKGIESARLRTYVGQEMMYLEVLDNHKSFKILLPGGNKVTCPMEGYCVNSSNRPIMEIRELSNNHAETISFRFDCHIGHETVVTLSMQAEYIKRFSYV